MDQTVRFWDIATAAEQRHLVGGQARGKAVAFARDGKIAPALYIASTAMGVVATVVASVGRAIYPRCRLA